MALPVFGIFLRKVYNDPQFGIMEADEFERPSNFNIELDCDKAKRESSRRGNYLKERY
jgi:penicillin-binding protein 1A